MTKRQGRGGTNRPRRAPLELSPAGTKAMKPVEADARDLAAAPGDEDISVAGTIGDGA